MKKTLLFSIMVLLFAISNLNAKTIWIKDLTDDNFGKFYNVLQDELKDTDYWKYCKYVTNNNQIKETSGDLIIEINGLYQTGTWVCFIIMCKVNEKYTWDYISNFEAMFSKEYIYENAIKAKKGIVLFFKNNF